MADTPESLVANVRVKFSDSDIKAGLAQINAAFKQLALESNKALRESVMSLRKDNFAGYIAALMEIGKESIEASDKIKALAKATEEGAKKTAEEVKKAEAEKRAARKETDAEGRRLISAFAAFNKSADTEAANVAKQAAAAKIAAERDLNAERKKLSREALATAKELAREEEKIAKQRLTLYQNIQKGSIGGLWNQFASGGMQGIGGLTGGGIGAGGVGGMITGTLGAGGAGMAQSLGLAGATAAQFATAAGAIMLVVAAVDALGEAFVKAYNNSQDYLYRISLIRREIGVYAQEASTVQSLLAFTQNANSPFSTIIFTQVASNLQNVADMEKGLLKANPQVMLMADGLKQLGIEARNSNGETKNVVDFAIELSRALQGLDPGKYSQTMQRIGGLFGKDFAAIVGMTPETLEAVRDSAIKVTEEQIRMAETRKAAITIANNAEMQFNINMTNGLTVIDIMLQRIKTDFFLILTRMIDAKIEVGNVGMLAVTSAREILRLAELAGVVPNGTTLAVSAGMEYGKRTGQFIQGGMGVAGGSAGIGDIKSREKALEDYKAAIVSTEAEIKKGIEAEKEAAENYARALGNLSKEWDAVNKAQERVFDLNDRAIKSFDGVLDSVMRAGNSYDDYYEKYRDLRKKIADLDKLEGSNVAIKGFTDSTGKFVPFGSKVEDVNKYLEAIRKEQAKDADEEARYQARLADWNARGRKGREPIPATNVQMVNEAIREGRIDDMGAKLGLEPGMVLTQENLATQWRKRGLTKEEIEQRQNAIRELEKLNFADKQDQFDVLRTGMQGYVESLINLQKETGVTVENQGAIQGAFEQMSKSLENFATKSGMFDSAGFVRAMAETGLQMRLTAGEFGTGAGAVQRYFDAQSKLFELMDKYAPVISRERAATTQEGVEAGIIGETFRADISGGGWETIAQQADLRKRFEAGQITGTEFSKLLLETQGMDTASIFEQTYKETFGKIQTEAENLTKGVEDGLKKIVENPYKIKIELDDVTVATVKAKLEELELARQQPGFKPPIGEGIPGNYPPGHAEGLMATILGGGMQSRVGTALPEDVTTLEGVLQWLAQLKQGTQQSDAIIPDMFWSTMPTGGVSANTVTGDVSKKIMDELKAAMAPVQDDLTANPLQVASEMDKEDIYTTIPEKIPSIKDFLQGRINEAGPLMWGVVVTPIGPQQPLPNVFNNIPKDAVGGSVEAGKPVWVGETGRELFWPRENGYIVGAMASERYAAQYAPRSVSSTTMHSFSNSSQSSVVNIDARGSVSPQQTAQAVRRVLPFISESASMSRMSELRRKGRIE